MKALRLLLLATWYALGCRAQTLKTDTLFITHNKTMSLLFPYRVLHIDRGSPEVLVETVKGQNHALLLKAASDRMTETNLSVFTEEGSIYSFVLFYDANPPAYVKKWGPLPFSVPLLAEQLLQYPPLFYKGGVDCEAPYLKVEGIYSKGQRLFLQLSLANETGMDYPFGALRVFIQSRQQGKRVARQQREVNMEYVAGRPALIKGGSKAKLVVVLSTPVLNSHQYLSVEVDSEGKQSIRQKISARLLKKAVPL